MQLSGLLSTDSPDCCGEHEGTFLPVAGTLPVWGGTEHRLHGQVSAHCCTPLVNGKTLVRAEGTKKGIENVPLLYRDPFFFQLRFGRGFPYLSWLHDTVAAPHPVTSKVQRKIDFQHIAVSSVTFICLPVQGTIANSLTCVQLHKRAEKIAVMLMERGHLQDGDHVALVYPPGKELPCSVP